MAKRAFSIGDLVVEMAFASEEPYERWWGVEILDVNDQSVRLGRLNDGAPVLYNHNWDDLRGVHVPGSVRADDDKVLRGKVRITSATQAGRDTIALVESGVLSKASVGYQIHKVIEQTTSKSGERIERELDGGLFERTLERFIARDGRAGARGDVHEFRRALDEAAGAFDRAADSETVYRVVDWEPHENSLVTVPADPTVGVGRMARQTPRLSTAAASASKGATMAGENAAAGATADQQSQEQQRQGGQQHEHRQAGQQSGERAVEMERARRRGIENLCKANKIDDSVRDYWIATGLSVEAITDDLVKIIEERGKNNPQSEAKLGLSSGEVKRYSLFNAIRAVADQNWSNAGFELDCSREIAKRLQRLPDPKKFFVPFEVQHDKRISPQRRDLTAASAAGGGYLVGTENMSFIEVLRNRSVAYRMGARRLSGLVGNVTIPRQSAAATAAWLANEGSQIPESGQTFGQMALSPKTVGAYTEISRQLLLQSSPDAEGIVTADLGAVSALAVDVGVLRGSGSGGEPTGIVNTSGIGTVNGATFDYADILEFQVDVATANVTPEMGGYVTTPTVAALAMQRTRFANTDTPLWQGNLWDGQMAGFQAMSTNQMSAGTMLFGDWRQVVVAEWGVLEIEVNPYANFQAGIIGIRAMVSIDVGLRYAGAFSYGAAMT